MIGGIGSLDRATFSGYLQATGLVQGFRPFARVLDCPRLPLHRPPKVSLLAVMAVLVAVVGQVPAVGSTPSGEAGSRWRLDSLEPALYIPF